MRTKSLIKAPTDSQPMLSEVDNENNETLTPEKVENTKFCVEPQLAQELEMLAEKYDRTSCDILMMGLSLFKMLDSFKEENRDLALLEKGRIVRKIVIR